MTKTELMQNVQKANADTQLTLKRLNAIVDTLWTEIRMALKKDGRIVIPGFGTLTVEKTKPRTGRNPRTGAAIKIKAGKKVRFRPAPVLKTGV